MSDMVAALYVETDGVYYGLPDVDPWDEARDARLYDGPWPVVAHPPCPKWSPLAYINSRRIPGYEIGDDGGCFAAALAAVRKFGGVLEHPARSLAWKHFGLPIPFRGGWSSHLGVATWDNLTDGMMHGHVTEVDQGSYGHPARKRTWLYVIGVDLPPLDWRVAESDAIVSGFTHQAKGEHVACEHRRVRPAEASRTPPAFRDVLLAMARTAGAEQESACEKAAHHARGHVSEERTRRSVC